MAFSHDEGTVAVHGDACLFFFAPEKTKENQKNAFEKLTLKFFRLVVNGVESSFIDQVYFAGGWAIAVFNT
jgi:hypothetical protein